MSNSMTDQTESATACYAALRDIGTRIGRRSSYRSFSGRGPARLTAQKERASFAASNMPAPTVFLGEQHLKLLKQCQAWVALAVFEETRDCRVSARSVDHGSQQSTRMSKRLPSLTFCYIGGLILLSLLNAVLPQISSPWRSVSRPRRRKLGDMTVEFAFLR
jgi:hypothetical protein